MVPAAGSQPIRRETQKGLVHIGGSRLGLGKYEGELHTEGFYLHANKSSAFRTTLII